MRVALLLAALSLVGCRGADSGATVQVYAAASLTDVMEALADTFRTREEGRYRVVLNVAGSSLLARQISRGARAELFVSAHPGWTDYLFDMGKLSAVDTLPISNRLVLVARSATDLTEGRVAIADPSHVPAGMYAREALTCDERWSDLEERVVPTLDVRSALNAVTEGAAESAVVYASDALLAPKLVVQDAVSERCQPSIRYTVGIVDRESEGAERFLRLLLDADMRAEWSRFGFESSSR